MSSALFAELLATRGGESGVPVYREFLRVSAMSAGLYLLPVGQKDAQQPHHEDELYYVIGGRGRMRVGNEERSVGTGMAVFIPAGMKHEFYAIEQDLTILVCFAPAEQSALQESLKR